MQPSRLVLCAAIGSAFLCAVGTRAASAQIGGNGSDGPLTPVADLTLDTSHNGGVFQFTLVAIPAGVTVTLTGPNPAVLQSQGRVQIAGVLRANGAAPKAGPGGWNGGLGGNLQYSPNNGEGPGGGGYGFSGENATHRSAYGSDYPFDERGGSGGGGGYVPLIALWGLPGGGGGGVIVVLADGSIQVTGAVEANGSDGEWTTLTAGYGGGGSGGSIMLRSLAGVAISGTVSAAGGQQGTVRGPGARADGGFVRIDSYGALPVLTGAIDPTPTVLELPAMRTEVSPVIGASWDLSIASSPGDVVLIVLAGQTQQLPVPPFGVLTLAGPIIGLGVAVVPTVGNDPQATFSIPIANAPALVGLTAYLQGFNGPFSATGRPRLTNGVSGTIGR